MSPPASQAQPRPSPQVQLSAASLLSPTAGNSVSPALPESWLSACPAPSPRVEFVYHTPPRSRSLGTTGAGRALSGSRSPKGGSSPPIWFQRGSLFASGLDTSGQFTPSPSRRSPHSSRAATGFVARRRKRRGSRVSRRAVSTQRRSRTTLSSARPLPLPPLDMPLPNVFIHSNDPAELDRWRKDLLERLGPFTPDRIVADSKQRSDLDAQSSSSVSSDLLSMLSPGAGDQSQVQTSPSSRSAASTLVYTPQSTDSEAHNREDSPRSSGLCSHPESGPSPGSGSPTSKSQGILSSLRSSPFSDVSYSSHGPAPEDPAPQAPPAMELGDQGDPVELREGPPCEPIDRHAAWSFFDLSPAETKRVFQELDPRALAKACAGFVVNHWSIPKGGALKAYLRAKTELVKNIGVSKGLGLHADSLDIVFPHVILQAEGGWGKGKAARGVRVRSILARLARWKRGEVLALFEEAKAINQDVANNELRRRAVEADERATRYMRLEHLIFNERFAAAKEELASLGAEEAPAAPVDAEVAQEGYKGKLSRPGAPADGYAIAKGEAPAPLPGKATIDHKLMSKAINLIRGAAGPNGVSAKELRARTIQAGVLGGKLTDAYADLATRLGIVRINPSLLTSFFMARGVAIPKPNSEDIRPLTIGCTAARAVEKAIGIQHGIEMAAVGGGDMVNLNQSDGAPATAKAFKAIWESEDAEAMLKLDAKNGFNLMYRVVAMHNLEYVCPAFALFARNRLSVVFDICFGVDRNGQVLCLKSEEGAGQGSPSGPSTYGMALLPLKWAADRAVRNKVVAELLEHFCSVFFADDGGAIGKLEALSVWLDAVQKAGLNVGYFLQLAKCTLFVKPQYEGKARRLFARFPNLKFVVANDSEEAGVTILKTPLGSEAYERKYLREKCEEWGELLTTLIPFAKACPQAAYIFYCRVLAPRWTFLSRTLPPDIVSAEVAPLTPLVRKLSAVIVRGEGNSLSELISNQFEVLSFLPVRHSGVGISIPERAAPEVYEAASRSVAFLTDLILNNFKIRRRITSVRNWSVADT